MATGSTSSAASQPSFLGRRALLIEDDEILVRFLDRLLRQEGFEINAAHNGLRALEMLESGIDVVILDLNLPGIDGLGVLKRLRERLPHLRVLVLTGRSRAESTVQALEAGADDCLHKPFSHVELLARLRALLRRQGHAVPQAAACGGLVLQKEMQRATRDGEFINLTPREFALLEYLMRTPGAAVPRSALHKELWGDQSIAGSNVVDVYMKYLRDKIDLPGKPRLIQTVRGIGYALCSS